MGSTIGELQSALDAFAEERDWAQFHTPKNLATALAVEAAEVLEHFQWLSDEQSRSLPPEVRHAVEQEVADVFLYLLQLAGKLEIDLVKAATDKMRINAAKYPVEKSKGTSRKYTDL